LCIAALIGVVVLAIDHFRHVESSAFAGAKDDSPLRARRAWVIAP
jgi:hypothetical protein